MPSIGIMKEFEPSRICKAQGHDLPNIISSQNSYEHEHQERSGIQARLQWQTMVSWLSCSKNLYQPVVMRLYQPCLHYAYKSISSTIAPFLCLLCTILCCFPSTHHHPRGSQSYSSWHRQCRDCISIWRSICPFSHEHQFRSSWTPSCYATFSVFTAGAVYLSAILNLHTMYLLAQFSPAFL